MRKAEFKKMYIKLMEYIGKKLVYYNQVDEWTDVEIASELGIAAPRLSEIKRYSTGGRIMSENTLEALIGGQIVTIDEIKEKVDLNEDETDYIDSFAIVGNKKLRAKAHAALKAGIDVEALLDKAIKDAQEKS